MSQRLPFLNAGAKTRSLEFWGIAGVFAFAFLIYFPAIRGGFIWDDDAYVTGNMALQNLHGLWEIWIHPQKLVQYYPLTFTSLWINYQLGGLNPVGYHLVNILLHSLNALLVHKLLKRLEVPGAWLAALLFLVHPVHVESVAWITERKNCLSGFFYLSAFLSYLRFKSGGPGSRPWYFYSYFLFLGAILSKTVAATFPVAMIFTLGWKERRFPSKDLLRMIPFFLSGAILGAVTTNFENFHMTSMGLPDWKFTVPERLLIAGRAFWLYLGKLVWPQPLIFIYPRWAIDSFSIGQWLFPVFFLILGAMLWIFRSRLGRGLWFAWAIFTITLLPALGLKSFYPMRFSFVADHFQYLASIAPFALVPVFIQYVSRKIFRGRFFLSISIAILVACSILTWHQCHIYKDLETLWRDTLSKNPECSMAHNNLAAILIDTGRYQEAFSHEIESIRFNENNPEAYNNLGVLAAKQKDFKKAIEYHTRAIQILPNSSDYHNNLGVTLFESGQTNEAVEQYLKAIELNPSVVNARCNLGNLLLFKGEIENAGRWYREALEWDPNYEDALVNLGLVLFKLGRTDDAMDYYWKALKIDPNLEVAHLNLAEALAAKGLNGQAEQHFLEAIRLQPGNAGLRIKYAAWLERQGKIDDAINQYNEIVRLDPQNQEAQSNLRNLAFRDFLKTRPK